MPRIMGKDGKPISVPFRRYTLTATAEGQSAKESVMVANEPKTIKSDAYPLSLFDTIEVGKGYVCFDGKKIETSVLGSSAKLKVKETEVEISLKMTLVP